MSASKNAVSCVSVENHQVLVRSAGHAWLVDEPPDLGGDGLGPNPFDLLLGALGACVVITVGHYAAQARIPLEGLWADVTGEQPPGDAAYRASLLVRVRGTLTDQDLDRLHRAVERCPVHRALSAGVAVTTEVRRA